jgi:hypothetical protein
MKSSWFKQLIPHGVAVLIFLVVAFVYCKPVLEGKVIAQHDITHWKGSIQQSAEYAKTHDGVYPLWTNSMFSGMPTFQIGYTSNNKVPWVAHQIFSLGLPKPMNFFFLACICFYFLSVVLGVRTIFGILGSLAFAYATYNPVIISVGHDTKMLSIAYMPALLASVLLIYEKRYWLGAGLTALFTAVLIVQNHPQIDYYLFLAISIMTIFYLVRWIKNKEWRHLGFAMAFTFTAALIGVLTNAVSLFSTYEYQKETIRGGATAIVDSTSKNDNAANGLSKDYALSYSMNILEPFVMMLPNIYGGVADKLIIPQEKSKAWEALAQVGQQNIDAIQQQTGIYLPNYTPTYWGGLSKPGEAGTSGPPYVGAIICVLAIFGFFFLDGKHKWWLLTTIGLTIVMSWGSFFETFNVLLYKYLPFYNKFRAPSMILVIPQLLIPVLAILGLEKIASTPDKKVLMPALKKGLYVSAGLLVLFFILYAMFDYLSGSNEDLLRSVNGLGNAQLSQIFSSFFDGLKADRKDLMMGSILRYLGFGAVAVLLLYFTIRKTISMTLLGILLIAFSLIDLFTIDVKYLNYESYKEKQENELAFVKTKPDDEILADKSQFRVFNVSGDAFQENITSYYYNSIGGYHPAKIAIYQELIEHKLSRQQRNTYVLNMLNTKYFIRKNGTSQTEAYQKNDSALGNCWLVKNIQYVKDANAEMNSLGNFNPADTAVVQDTFKSSIPFEPVYDSSATIALVKNDNDIVTYTFNAASNQFAVFSEVYYKNGWKAYIGGKEAPIVKVNYVLRGLAVPAGKHDIRFEFKPQGYYKGKGLTSIFSIVLLVILAIGIFMEWRNRNQTALANRV